MLKRLPSFNMFDRRDVLLMAAVTLGALAITAAWAFGFAIDGRAPFASQNASKYFLVLVYFGLAAVAAVLPFISWGRREDHRLARFVVRGGIALQFIAVFSSLVGLLFATSPVVSVPVGFATFTAMLTGLLAAGFAGNALAPAKA